MYVFLLFQKTCPVSLFSNFIYDRYIARFFGLKNLTCMEFLVVISQLVYEAIASSKKFMKIDCKYSKGTHSLPIAKNRF
jgi:hypothetical protein